MLTSLFSATFGRGATAAPPPVVPTSASPVDPITGLVHSRRLASGVPFGGIGTGTFQVLTDGHISAATYNNNWAYPTRDIPGCFAAIQVRTGTRSVSRVLALSNAYGLPAIAGMTYDGLYPVAKLAFQDAALPVAVSSRVFSPLVPHDIRSSSFPAAAFIYRLTNTSAGEIEVSLALSWENTLGVGGTVATGPFDDRTGNTVAVIPDSDGFFAERLSRSPAPDSNSDAKLKNNATGDMTLMAAPGRPQAIVTTASWNALDERPGWWSGFEADGGVRGAVEPGASGEDHPAGVICVRLTLKPRETVDLPYTISWYTPRLNTTEGGDYGHYYQNLWPDSYAVARGLLTEWHSLLALTEEWQQRILFSNLPRWMCRRLINSASPLTTHSIWTRDQAFAVLNDVGGLSFGRMPAAADPAAIPQTAPARDDFGLGPRAARPGSRLASLSQRLPASTLLCDFYPMLAARELRLFMARQAAEGAFPATLGDIDRVIGVPQPGSVAAVEEALALDSGPHLPIRSPDALDDNSAFVLQMAEYVFRTGDHEFLHAYFPNVRRALGLFFDNLDPDGLPAVGPDAALTPASATLYLAALQAGARMSRLSGSQAYLDMKARTGLNGALAAIERAKRQAEDVALAARCDVARKRAAEAIDRRFWNGGVYAERSSSGSAVSSIRQLLGVGFSDRLGGEGPAIANQDGVLPDDKILAAVAGLQRLNDDRTLAPLAPIDRVSLSGAGLPRLSDLSGALLGKAVLSLTRRQPESAVALLRRLDETCNDVLLSPWQSPAHFAADTGETPRFEGAGLAHAADWNVLAPLEGFVIDLSAGQFALSPQIPGNWRSIAGPIFAPTFWGRLEFRPTARGGVTNLRIDRLIALPAATTAGRLSGSAGLVVVRLRIPGPPPRPAGAPAIEPPVAHVSRGTTPLGVKSVRDRSGDFILTFETPVKLTAGDRLEIDLH